MVVPAHATTGCAGPTGQPDQLLAMLAGGWCCWWDWSSGCGPSPARTSGRTRSTPSPPRRAPRRRSPVTGGAPPTPGGQVTPISLRIKKIGVSATVVPTGVDRAGDFAVPPSVNRVGWYKFGPGLALDRFHRHRRPCGQRHPGPRRVLPAARPRSGRPDPVTGSDEVRRYTVVAREEYRKTQVRCRILRHHRIGAADPDHLRWPVDRQTHHYRDNIVVTAVPA